MFTRPDKPIAGRPPATTSYQATQEATVKRADTTRTRTRVYPRINARFTFLLYLAVVVGTFPLEATLRATILWSVLIALTLAHVAAQPLAMSYALTPIQRGALIGLACALPLAIVAQDFLIPLATLSLGVRSGALLFQRLIFIVAPLEELFYRGCVQRERGVVESTLYYTLGSVAFYWPLMQDYWRVTAALAIGHALFGGLFAFIAKRYGVSAAIACHTACNFCLFIAPSLVRELGRLVN